MSAVPKKKPLLRVGVQKIGQQIMLEQSKLVEAQKNLRALVTLIDQKLNVLKVEELQIRSNLIAATVKHEPTNNFKTETPNNYDFDQSTDDINKYNLDLDLFKANTFKKVEEDDDDDL